MSGIHTKFFQIGAIALFMAIFYPGERLFAGGNSGFDWFWMFYEKDKTEKYSTVVYRPFFMRNTYSPNNYCNSFEASLMPVVYWKYTTSRKTEWKSFFSFVDSIDYRHTDGIMDYDLGILPVLFYGSSPDPRDRYLMILPFGGTIKGKLGQDRITAYAFPGFLLFFLYPPASLFSLQTIIYVAACFIPVYVDYEDRDYKAKGILWPLVQWGKSENRDDFRILPIYGHNYKKDYYDNYSFLFIGNYQHVFLRHDEQKTLFVLPFYGRRWSRSNDNNASSLLWPVFSWGYNRKAGDLEINFPWPLVMIQDCQSPKIYKRIFFPFYGKYIFDNQQTVFITPLYMSLKRSNENFESNYYINCLIAWYFERQYLKKPHPVYGKSWHFIKLWPLFQYEYDNRGNTSFNLLSILPFHDPEGYELLYQTFWTLFEYRKLVSGEKRMGFLLRIYYQTWGESFLNIKIPLLFAYSRSKDVLTKISFLSSMFGYARDEKGSHIYLFWIPVTVNSEDKMEYGTDALPDDPENSREQYMALLSPFYDAHVNRQIVSKNLNWNYCYYSSRGF